MNKRDYIGIVGYFFLTILLTMIITFPLMLIREIYQYKKYLKPCGIDFEYDDVERYFITIIIAQLFQILIILLLW